MTVLILLRDVENVPVLTGLAAGLARDDGVTLHLLYLLPGPEATPRLLEQGAPLPDDLPPLWQEAATTIFAALPGDSPPARLEIGTGRRTFHILRRSVRACNPAALVLTRPGRDQQDQALVNRVLTEIPCDVLVLRLPRAGGGAVPPQRILVAAARGRHTAAAIAAGHRLATRAGGRLHALYVEPEGGEDAAEVGMRQLRRNLTSAGVDPEKTDLRVVMADQVVKGIAGANPEDYDLVLFGASEKGLLRRIDKTLEVRRAGSPDDIAALVS